MKKINIRESLLNMDRETNCQYDLTSLYEACKLDDKKKSELVKYIDAYDFDATNRFLSNEAASQGLMENTSDDIDDEEVDKYAINEEADNFNFNDEGDEATLDEKYVNGKWEPEFSDDWKPEDIELWKSIDWKARNYTPYVVEDDTFTGEVVAYGLPGGEQRATATFVKHICPNPIFSPTYKPLDDPFEGTGTNGWYSYDGVKHDGYLVMTRTETQELSDMLSEALFEVEADWWDYCPHCTSRALHGVGDGRAVCDECGDEFEIVAIGNNKVRIIPIDELTEGILDKFKSAATNVGKAAMGVGQGIVNGLRKPTAEHPERGGFKQVAKDAWNDVKYGAQFAKDGIKDYIKNPTAPENKNQRVKINGKNVPAKDVEYVKTDKRGNTTIVDADKFSKLKPEEQKEYSPALREDIYENDDWDYEPGVRENGVFDYEGKDYSWTKRIGDVHHLDFDNWAVWEATNHDDETVEYFIVDEDTEFIDWGPCDTVEEAQEFLASKVADWENDEYDLDEAVKPDESTIAADLATELAKRGLRLDPNSFAAAVEYIEATEMSIEEWIRETKNNYPEYFADDIEEGYELSPQIDYNPNHLRDDEGKIMADRWYASKWPDDEVGIEQLKGLTLDDALKDRSILGHCDTQVRERVYAQLDKYIPLSVDSPMYREKNEDINDSDEVLTFKRDINLASDADEIQQLIYELSDGVAEDNAQQAFNENENNDLKTLKNAVITAIDVYLEDNEWLGESKSINESGYKLTIEKDGETFTDYCHDYREESAIAQMKAKYGDNISIKNVEEHNKSDNINESKSINEDIEDIVSFEKEMVQKYPELREIEEAETMDSGATRYIAWLKFPYYSSDSNGGFFSFFSEEEFDKWINSLGKWRVEQDKLINDTNTPFEPDQYTEFCDTYKTYDEKYNAALKVLKSKSINESSYKKGDRVELANGMTGTVTKDFDWENEDQVSVEIDGTGEMRYPRSEMLKDLREDATNPTCSWMIVKMGEDGVHYYYNASENIFTSDIDAGTRYAEREIINDDFKEVSKNNDNCYMRKIPDMPDWEPLQESANTMIYLFPELTDEDLEMAKGYGLQFLGKNHGADGSEDNWVMKGQESSLRMFADNYLGYELHPDYLYDEEDFAGDIINESLVGLELDKDDILDWLAEHEQAWADAERYFGGSPMEFAMTSDADSPLEEVSVKDLIEWIADHRQLYNDFYNFFYEDIPDDAFADDIEPSNENLDEAATNFQKEFYNGYVILKNRAGEGWDIYSYDGTPEKVTKAYLEDEGYGTLQSAKDEIDKWIKKSDLDESLNESFDDDFSDEELASIFGGDTKNDVPDGIETPEETEARLSLDDLED